MKRAIARGKCKCDKTTYTTWGRAAKAVQSASAERPYWCPEAGGYHITRYTRSEQDQRRQDFEKTRQRKAERDRKVQEVRLARRLRFERKQQRRSSDGAGKRSRRAS